MFEKVTPAHPDKIADRVAGAIVDLAYEKEKDPKIAVEVLIGHGICHIIIETSVILPYDDIASAVHRIAGEKVQVDLKQYPQDKHLAANQDGRMRCGDNGIFRGVPVTREQELLTALTKELYERYHADGKCIKDGKKLVICQSNADLERLKKFLPKAKINPLGSWTGGLDVDSGATNRKLGSDMGDAVTGGGLHGKVLQTQEEYFKRQNNNTSTDPLDPDEPDEEFDIVKYANDIINGKVPAYLPDAEVVTDE